VFTARYGLIPYIKQITCRLYKVNSILAVGPAPQFATRQIADRRVLSPFWGRPGQRPWLSRSVCQYDWQLCGPSLSNKFRAGVSIVADLSAPRELWGCFSCDVATGKWRRRCGRPCQVVQVELGCLDLAGEETALHWNFGRHCVTWREIGILKCSIVWCNTELSS
jgi:hypothetical protein